MRRSTRTLATDSTNKGQIFSKDVMSKTWSWICEKKIWILIEMRVESIPCRELFFNSSPIRCKSKISSAYLGRRQAVKPLIGRSNWIQRKFMSSLTHLTVTFRNDESMSIQKKQSLAENWTRWHNRGCQKNNENDMIHIKSIYNLFIEWVFETNTDNCLLNQS